ncbi:GNAT family N-acetyltransferase [Egicoccus halophilus]|uniref:N-acetyltransferase n=1 Tax=Egicoccus halophilus TaxID=1670830 RepID=A0A8J3ET14_9ACTN|nr:GNAT family N-acetyltransferase [Egicoccus halophilus]GGI08594.1 N-acetyltransferase [Egicoccus halophilus]
MDIERDPDGQRYVASDDGREVGELTFAQEAGTLRLLHTKVDEAAEGRGIGGGLARRALDDARRDGLRVDPQCQFVAGWIERHPEYAELVAED